MEPHRPRVVIVGGGFGGLEAARTLRRAPVRVVLVDRRNHHLFQPLLYQVATAALSPADIASPIRQILRRQRETEVVMAEVVGVDRGARALLLSDGERIGYDFLVIATGAVDQYFGHPEWAEVAPGLKTIDDALEIRRRFLLGFEAAEREPDPVARQALLTTVVVGAGPTGVEMAGAMAEMARHSLIRDFRRIDPSTARVILLEGGERILAAYAPALSARAEEDLRRRGVEVRKRSIVTRITAEGVYVGDEYISTRNVIWAAGVAGSPLGAALGSELDRAGRVKVEGDLSLPGHPEIFVIGDLASAAGEDGDPLPGLAPVAKQQGRWAAENILRTLRGEERRAFRYRDRGSMATIGRGAAIAVIGRVQLKGLLAWLAWLFVHVMSLVGFRNRVAVFMEWAWAYLTWQRGARLITGGVAPDLAPLGDPGRREPPEREVAGRVAERTGGGSASERETGWMAGDEDQAARG
jgi:NADH:ubiquinone reductase (H+-translocating)